jgi:hypothetical protein
MAVDKSGEAGRGTTTGMVTAPDADKGRHVYGPRPLAALVPGIARPALRKRSPAAAQLIADWSAIVGPALANRTVPKKLVGGRLTIGCTGPVAMELQYLAPQLIARINLHSGAIVVEQLAFVQAIEAVPPPSIRPKPTEETNKRAEYAVRHLPDGELRAALAALGRAVMTERPDSTTPSTAIIPKP